VRVMWARTFRILLYYSDVGNEIPKTKNCDDSQNILCLNLGFTFSFVFLLEKSNPFQVCRMLFSFFQRFVEIINHYVLCTLVLPIRVCHQGLTHWILFFRKLEHYIRFNSAFFATVS
jgi:hypothetical protein